MRTKAERDAALASAEFLRGGLLKQSLTLERLSHSAIYRGMRAAGLWGWVRLPVRAAVKSRKLRRVAIDLTPVLPGAANGGAKVMTVELIRQLAKLAPECEFVLLTASGSHDELKYLDAPNVRRVCVHDPGGAPVAAKINSRAKKAIARVLPEPVLRVAMEMRNRHLEEPAGTSMLETMSADLLFCPFTAPFFYDPSIPVISVIYDLQYAQYPAFFSNAEVEERDRSFHKAVRVANMLVCISEFVRGTVIARSGINADRVVAVPIRLQNRLEAPASVQIEAVQMRWGLRPGRYLVYPANFWKHKNHELLLTAFGMYCAAQPGSDLKLVLTGAPGARAEELRQASVIMGLGERVVFAGHLSDSDFAGLLKGCLALIFPSLYEGFGMPVLEAMAMGKPVLCSNVTSLPEVAGDAAVQFDPRVPSEIVAAIRRVDGDPELARILGEKGRLRASALGGPREMAAEYLGLFRAAAGAEGHRSTSIEGVYPDGWTGERVTVRFKKATISRKLELLLEFPGWGAENSLTVRLLCTDEKPQKKVLSRGERITLEQDLPQAGGSVQLKFDLVFQPKSLGLGDDTRQLGCRFLAGRILAADGGTEVLGPGEYAG